MILPSSPMVPRMRSGDESVGMKNSCKYGESVRMKLYEEKMFL